MDSQASLDFIVRKKEREGRGKRGKEEENECREGEEKGGREGGE